jgi:Protein of unknown function (DUF3225)
MTALRLLHFTVLSLLAARPAAAAEKSARRGDLRRIRQRPWLESRDARRADGGEGGDPGRLERHRRARRAVLEKPHTLRYGVPRTSTATTRSPPFAAAGRRINLARDLLKTVITTYGRDFATPTSNSSASARRSQAGRARSGSGPKPAGWSSPPRKRIRRITGRGRRG